MLALLATMGLLAAEPRACEAAMVEATFAPLPRSEKRFARLGPAGPFYPQVALSTDGEAVLHCEIAEGGVLKDCKILSESPSRRNFGVAARVMAERRRILVNAPNAVGNRWVIRVPFVRGAPVEMEP